MSYAANEPATLKIEQLSQLRQKQKKLRFVDLFAGLGEVAPQI
jgi:hypothetical protein